MIPIVLSMKAALDSLAANPLRTLLSTLGVMIGVAALVAILALGDGLEAYSRAQIAATTDLQTLRVTPRVTERRDGILVRVEDPPVLRGREVAELSERLAERATAALFVVGSGRAAVPGDTMRRGVLVTATEPGAAAQLPGSLAAGRFLEPGDLAGDNRVTIVPASVAAWYGTTPARLAGRTLDIDGIAWEIVGVLEEGGEQPTRVIVPLGAAVRAALERPDRPVALAVRAERVEELASITADVESWLAARYGSADRFRLESNRERVAQAQQAMLVFKLVMGAIAGIALLVGGIGIMNILLASVFERTREIGIRKAAGARQRDIRLQFLAEAVAITGLGSAAGVGIGLAGAFGISAGIRRLTEAPLAAGFTWGSVAVAAGAALLVGLVFGTYPARRAARLSPIEAIRHE